MDVILCTRAVDLLRDFKAPFAEFASRDIDTISTNIVAA